MSLTFPGSIYIYTAVLIYCWYIDTNIAACMVKSMVKSCRSKASGNTTWLDTKILGMYQLCFLKKRRWPSRSWLRSSVLLDPHGSPTLLFGGKKHAFATLIPPCLLLQQWPILDTMPYFSRWLVHLHRKRMKYSVVSCKWSMDINPICSTYGIFTYKTGWFWGQMLVCIFQHHGLHMGMGQSRTPHPSNRAPQSGFVPPAGLSASSPSSAWFRPSGR